jgi:hypothetical protein
LRLRRYATSACRRLVERGYTGLKIEREGVPDQGLGLVGGISGTDVGEFRAEVRSFAFDHVTVLVLVNHQAVEAAWMLLKGGKVSKFTPMLKLVTSPGDTV